MKSMSLCWIKDQVCSLKVIFAFYSPSTICKLLLGMCAIWPNTWSKSQYKQTLFSESLWPFYWVHLLNLLVRQVANHVVKWQLLDAFWCLEEVKNRFKEPWNWHDCWCQERLVWVFQKPLNLDFFLVQLNIVADHPWALMTIVYNPPFASNSFLEFDKFLICQLPLQY